MIPSRICFPFGHLLQGFIYTLFQVFLQGSLTSLWKKSRWKSYMVFSRNSFMNFFTTFPKFASKISSLIPLEIIKCIFLIFFLEELQKVFQRFLEKLSKKLSRILCKIFHWFRMKISEKVFSRISFEIPPRMRFEILLEIP